MLEDHGRNVFVAGKMDSRECSVVVPQALYSFDSRNPCGLCCVYDSVVLFVVHTEPVDTRLEQMQDLYFMNRSCKDLMVVEAMIAHKPDCVAILL